MVACTQKKKRSQNGSSEAPFLSAEQTPLWHYFGSSFLSGAVFLNMIMKENSAREVPKQCQGGTKIVPLSKEAPFFYKKRLKMAPHIHKAPKQCHFFKEGPFLTFFCWKTVPQGSQNSTSFSKVAPFPTFFRKMAPLLKVALFWCLRGTISNLFFRENGSSLQKGTILVPLRHRF